MKLSIVATLYYSAPYLREFHARARAAAEQITSDFEFVLVNDGSPDDSLEVALSLFRADPGVRIVDLSRNFGHHKAIMTGLAHARGELIFLVDTDLEEEPELLRSFYDTLTGSGADVAYGIQMKRKGKAFERISGALYFKLFNLLCTETIPANHLTARLMTRRYVDALVQYKERDFVLSGLWVLTGFEQIPVAVQKRAKSSSTYTFRRKMSHLLNAITSFSNKPLILISYLGFGISAVAAFAATYLIIRKVFWGALLGGWPSLIVSIWLLGGLTIFSVGVIGIYLAKIFVEVKQRPYAIIKHVYEHGSLDEEPARNQSPRTDAQAVIGQNPPDQG